MLKTVGPEPSGLCATGATCAFPVIELSAPSTPVVVAGTREEKFSLSWNVLDPRGVLGNKLLVTQPLQQRGRVPGSDSKCTFPTEKEGNETDARPVLFEPVKRRIQLSRGGFCVGRVWIKTDVVDRSRSAHDGVLHGLRDDSPGQATRTETVGGWYHADGAHTNEASSVAREHLAQQEKRDGREPLRAAELAAVTCWEHQCAGKDTHTVENQREDWVVPT